MVAMLTIYALINLLLSEPAIGCWPPQLRSEKQVWAEQNPLQNWLCIEKRNDQSNKAAVNDIELFYQFLFIYHGTERTQKRSNVIE